MNNKKNIRADNHSPETALTQEIDLLNIRPSNRKTKPTSDFDAITEQLHVAPDALSTVEIDLSKPR
jgi:hypothetical protein